LTGGDELGESAGLDDIQRALDALPPARWCFSSRKPSEILRSMGRSPSGWLATPRGLLRAARLLDDVDPEATPVEAVLHGLLARYLRSALAAHSDDCMCVDYASFDADTVTQIASFFWARSFDSSTVDRMRESLTYYSKSRERRAFVPDQSLTSSATGAPYLDDSYDDYIRRFFPALYL